MRLWAGAGRRCPERTSAIHPDYLDDSDTHGESEVNSADRSLSLSRGFRALKVWMTVQTFGLAACRQAIERNLAPAQLAEGPVGDHPSLSLLAPVSLGVVRFRRELPGRSEAEVEQFGLGLIEELERVGRALVSSTRLAGRYSVGLCVLNPTSGEDDVHRVIEHFATGLPASAKRPLGPVTDPRVRVAGTPGPRDRFPCLNGSPRHVLAGLGDRVAPVTTGPGEEIVRRFDGDHDFYLVEDGSFVVVLDGRVIGVLAPGEHFGELAARDWGVGYGYVRLATVRGVGPGRLLRLTADDFVWLCNESPGFRSAMAESTVERLGTR